MKTRTASLALALTTVLALGTGSEAVARGFDGHRDFDRGHPYSRYQHRDHRRWKHHDRHHYRYPRSFHHRHYRCDDCYGYPWGAYGLGVLTGYLLNDYR
jgi:hypothetical protein